MHEAPHHPVSSLGKLSAGIGSFAVAAMAAMTLLGILARVARIGILAGVNEITGYFLGVCALGASAYTFERGSFPRVRWALDRYFRPAKRPLTIVATAGAFACSTAYTLGVLKLALEALRWDARAIGLLNLPLVVPLAILVICLIGLDVAILKMGERF